jgi:hypothetical protein
MDKLTDEQIRVNKTCLSMKQQRERVNIEYKHRTEILELENKQLVYPNQKKAVDEIIHHYTNGKMAVCLVAQPGVGKTGVALELGYRVAIHLDDNIIVDTANIHTHCGMNDVEWKEQYEKNMLPSLRVNIAHRSVIKNSLKELQVLENGLIMTDEGHIASGKGMSQSKVLKDAGLLNIDTLIVKRNKLCQISATPEGIIEDMNKWGDDKAALVILKPGPIYKGFQTMIDEQRIIDAPELITLNDIEQFLDIFESRYNGHTKRFFPMRGLTGEVLEHIRTVAIRKGWEVKHHDSIDTIDDVDKLMSTPPNKHTIISLKEYWRASKRMKRTHIGGTYEKPPKQRNTSATSQGLTARQCDNYVYEGDWLNPNLRPLHFCDLVAIEEYLDWYNNGCNYKIATYTSANLKSKNGKVKSRKTLLHPSNIDGLDEVKFNSSDNSLNNNNYLLSEIFQSQSDAMEWGNSHINWSGDWNTREQRNTWRVNPCNPDNSPGNTHVRYAGKAYPITTEAEFKIQGNFSRFGYGVRCVPIKTADTLSYIIVYKASWLRT